MQSTPKVRIWAWRDSCWCSFFSRVSGWRTVTFELPGFYCRDRGRSRLWGQAGAQDAAVLHATLNCGLRSCMPYFVLFGGTHAILYSRIALSGSTGLKAEWPLPDYFIALCLWGYPALKAELSAKLRQST